jgi:molybdopterin converting factor small subunit
MKILVKYSGILSEILGVYSEILEVPETTSIKELLSLLIKQHERLRRIIETIPVIQVYINGKEVPFYSKNTQLKNHDEITFSLPLFEGG